MKRLRKHPLLLLAIAVVLPLGAAFLYYDFYDDNDLVSLKQISMADNEDLLSFLRKNPRVFVAAYEPPQSAGINLSNTKSFLSIHSSLPSQANSILRC